MSSEDRLSFTNRVAIIGMAVRTPGANNIGEFWENLCSGKESITFLTEDELRASGTPEWLFRLNQYVRAAGILQDAELFDASFFDISPQEARLIDPQHRVFLETAWEVLERAGYSPASYDGSIGVFAGCCLNDYLSDQISASVEESSTPSIMSKFMALLGGDKDYLSTRVSYKLNLKGPSMTIQTACSTSLVAVHLACQSLLLGECDLALAGGVTIRPPQKSGYPHTPDMIFSADGHTRTFDANASGTVFTNGIGIVALKRLEDAINDQDHIEAIICGSAINNDGSAGKAAFSAPSLNGQAQVIAQALAMAEVDPASIRYLEAHGTATILGDPVEVSALTKVFRSYTSEKQFCAIGSVKSNIGHPVHAAGVIGLIKAALMLKHKKLVPSVNFDRPNPQIDFENSPFYVNTSLKDWNSMSSPLRAGVSSFGVGGTNAHVILEEAPSVPRDEGKLLNGSHILKLSAKTPEALKTLASRFAEYFAEENVTPAEVCYTANTGRPDFHHRFAVTGSCREDFTGPLNRFATGMNDPDFIQEEIRQPGVDPKIGFLFTGQGCQYPGMGKKLYETEPVFRNSLNRCNEILIDLLPRSLLTVLYPSTRQDEALLDQTLYTQPALFAVEYSLAQLWGSWGVEPEVLVGHSIGEYVAACIAGVFPLEQILPLVARRAKMMNDLPDTGAMVAVFAGPESLSDTLSNYSGMVSVAAVNAPDLTILSGDRRALSDLLGVFETQKLFFKRLNVSHAFHSPFMDSILDRFQDAASRIEYSLPQKMLISNVTGTLVQGDFQYDSTYLRRHLRETVQFSNCLRTLQEQECDFLIELGPHPVLIDLARKQFTGSKVCFLPSLRKETDDSKVILESLGKIYSGGSKIDWANYYKEKKTRRLELPVYPFDRKLYWIDRNVEAPKRTAVSTAEEIIHPLLGRRIESPLPFAQFENCLDVRNIPFLKDHRVHDRIVFPAAGCIEMMMAAAREMESTESASFHEIVFREPLFLDNNSQNLQLIWKPLEPGRASIEIYYLSEPGWKLYVSAEYRGPGPIHESLDPLDVLSSRCVEPVDISQFYLHKQEIGMNHGPAFQGVRQLRKGKGEALGIVEMPAESAELHQGYFVHPVLIDSCLQVKEASIDRSSSNRRLYLPVIIETLRVYGRLTSPLWGWVRGANGIQTESEIRTIDLVAMDQAGKALLEMKNMHLKSANASAYARSVTDESSNFYEMEWKGIPLRSESSGVPDPSSRKFLVFYDDRSRADELLARLRESGDVIPIRLSNEGANGHDDFLRLFRKTDDVARREVVYLSSASSRKSDQFDLAIVDEALETFFNLTRAVASERNPGTLWLVTRGAQKVGHEGTQINLHQTALWGMGKVIPRELPDFDCRLVDLDPQDVSFAQLADEIIANTPADQVAFRNGERYRPRLTRKKPGATSTQQLLSIPPEPYQIVVGRPGILDSLTAVRQESREPGPEEVLIRITATGLNFRDVLIALGRFDGPVGFECSGTVIKMGERVNRFRIGDEVICVANNSLSSFVCVDQQMVAAKPGNIDAKLAAGIPLPFLTAYHALHRCARLQKGERVLIHAAAGGVGLAAVQIARRIGAEIFATASSPKWDYLKSLGLKHVLNSRTLDFTDYIRTETKGQGVDVVLNSLADEFIPASVSVLSENGRFVEIGATNILRPEEFSQRKPKASYFSFHLRDVANQDPDGFQEILQKILSGLEKEELHALPTQIFSSAETAQAFRRMAQAKHIGKIVISHEPVESSRPEKATIRGDSSYLITGGLGALGLYTAQWLVEKGARHIVLLGRRSPSVEAQAAIGNLRQKGAEVHVLQSDVSLPEQVQQVLNHIQNSMPPLRGIWHAAGVLHDALLQQQSVERMRAVTAPKIHGAWNLHRLTSGMQLDYFVLFSSMSAIMGSQGQTTYAAANAFLDGFAHFRRSSGLPALSINWGSWGGGGMAVSLDPRIKADRQARGLLELSPAIAFKHMEAALAGDLTQICVAEVDWSKFMLQEQVRNNYFFSAFTSQLPKAKIEKKSGSELLTNLNSSPGETHLAQLIAHLSEIVAMTLGIHTGELNNRDSLTSLGVDSLMSIELSNRIQNTIGVHLPMVVFLKGLTIEQLAREMLERLNPGPNKAARMN